MAYDRADWHYSGDYPDDLPPENGGTHIGMYLSWAFRRGFAGQQHGEGGAEALARVRAGELSGRDFLFQHCDEKFTAEDLNDEGAAFTDAYYAESYLEDYGDCFDSVEPSLYHVPATADAQQRVDAFLDRRLAEWRGTRKKPWWKFW